MDKKLIAKLAEKSYVDNILDSERVKKIIKHINQKELKEYLKALRRIDARLTVYVDYAFDISEINKKKLIGLFEKKNVIFRKDPSLVFGIKITDDDKVYNLNMKSALKQISGYLERSL